MDQFLFILLIIVGYFVLFGLVLSRSDRNWSVSSMLLVTLLIYIPVMAAVAAASSYLGETGLVLFGIAAVYSCLYWLWKFCGLFRRRPNIRFHILASLAAYLLAVFYITIFMRESGTNNRLQLEVLHWLHSGENGAWKHMLQNLVLFIPVGFLYCFLPKGQGKTFIAGASFGLLLSVLIETMQLLLHSGSCDIDDIIANFIGAAAGAGCAAGWKRVEMQRKNRKRRTDEE